MNIGKALQILKENKKRQAEISAEFYDKVLEGVEADIAYAYLEYNEALEEKNRIINEALQKYLISDHIINESLEIEIDLNEYDVVNEAETFYTSTVHGKYPAMFIKIDDEDTQADGYLKDPYIGIYDGPSFGKSKNMVRVSIFEKNEDKKDKSKKEKEEDQTPRLLNHNNVGKKAKLGHLPKNSEQLKVLNKIMKTPCNFGSYVGVPVKDAIKDYIRNKIEGSNMKNKESYLKEYDEKEFLDFSDYKEERSADKLAKYNR